MTTLFEKFESSFRSHYSTETALLKIVYDIRMNSDAGWCTVLVLLDLAAAFDTVDLDILISRLENCVGVTESALDWFRSYLSNRTFLYLLEMFFPFMQTLAVVFLKDRFLALFTLYTLPLGHVIRSFNIFPFLCR